MFTTQSVHVNIFSSSVPAVFSVSAVTEFLFSLITIFYNGGGQEQVDLTELSSS